MDREELQDLIAECFIGRISPDVVAKEIWGLGKEGTDDIWNILMKWKQKEIEAKRQVAKENSRFLWFSKEITAEQYEYMNEPFNNAVDEIRRKYIAG